MAAQYTLRQIQKILSLSSKSAGVDFKHNLSALANFAAGHDRFRHTKVLNGEIVNRCSCDNCVTAGRAINVRSLVDSLVSKYGPHTDLATALSEEAARQQQQQQPPQQGNQQSGSGQSDKGQPEPQNNAGSSSSSQQPASDSQSSPQPGQVRPTGSAPSPAQPVSAAQQAAALAKAETDRQKQAFQHAKREMERLAAAARKHGGGFKSAYRDAKRQFRLARRKASHNAARVMAGPSLSARKHLSTAHGRLRRVPQNLRNQMAELINRLVSQSGTVGAQFGPIPVLSARKVVSRMLVKRPLQNALKEDSVSGRPVTLFLPDISPSCEQQAQISCDLANAAGYAGTTGSDVLVFPHFNGEVKAEEPYFPWMNGKPITTNVKEIPNLFHDVCAGRSRFKVRVVVCIGDHDAVDQYGSIAALKTVLRIVWLHNWADSGQRGRVEPVLAGSVLSPGWSPDSMDKLSMVRGCVSLGSMLRGFDVALQQR